MKNKKAQGLLEYALILGIVTVALLAMQTYFKRGIQSMIKVVADDYGPQGDPVSASEIAIKEKLYAEYGPSTDSSTINSSPRRQTTQNNGESNIYRGELTDATTTITADSFWVGGDYRRRGREEPKGSSSAAPKK